MQGAAEQAQDTVHRLFEELSNPVRLQMLRALSGAPATVTGLGNVVGLRPQEVSRHLGRLADLDLIQRGASRAYTASPFGRVVVEELPSFAALLARRAFFQGHHLDGLPPGAPMRPLATANHLRGSESDNMERALAALGRAERRVAYVGNQLGWVSAGLQGAAQRGCEVEAVLAWTLAGHEGLLTLDERLGPDAIGRVTLRLLEHAPLLLLATEHEALAFFPLANGAMDFSHLVQGDDASFTGWAGDILEKLRARAVLAHSPAQALEGWRKAVTVAATQFVGPRRRALPPA